MNERFEFNVAVPKKLAPEIRRVIEREISKALEEVGEVTVGTPCTCSGCQS
jgi:hypothetical protein